MQISILSIANMQTSNLAKDLIIRENSWKTFVDYWISPSQNKAKSIYEIQILKRTIQKDYHLLLRRLRTPNEAFYHWNLKLLGLSRQKGQINSGVHIWGILSQTINTRFGTGSPLSMFSIIQPLFLEKTKPINSLPKYLFGIRIWIWATKS